VAAFSLANSVQTQWKLVLHLLDEMQNKTIQPNEAFGDLGKKISSAFFQVLKFFLGSFE